VLATGLLTFVGLYGVGSIVLHCIRLSVAPPWKQVTAVLLGILLLSLVVQIFAITESASPVVLRAIWAIVAIIGGGLVVWKACAKPSGDFAIRPNYELLLIALICGVVVVDLLVALAPSTKIDELYYHMLVPSRIVADGALRFYRAPIEGAIWPDMIYQISAAPSHAMGFPDATNVVSWGLSTTLLWFAWHIIRASAKPATWAGLWTAALCVGIYPVVWHVTGGAHAMGDLAMAVAVVAFCSRERLLVGIPAPAYAAMLSILLLSASASKITLLPISAIFLCLAACSLFSSVDSTKAWRMGLAMVAPWIVFYCPIAAWTWIQSGSPFGPVLADVLGPSIYPEGWAKETFEINRFVNQPSLITTVQYVAVAYSPLIWLGVFGAIVMTDLSRVVRATLGGLLVLQTALIYVLLPHDGRFLGGLQFGLAIVFAGFVTRNVMDWCAAQKLAAMCVMFVIPWFAIQVYYAKQFFLVSLGGEKATFYERYVAFYSDYQMLNRLLPRNAVLLVRDFRLDAVYAPRPVYFDRADVPEGKHILLFTLPETIRGDGPFDGTKSGKIIYENSNAVTRTYRTPGKQPLMGRLEVVELSQN
jgi:hypothetical protein